MAGVSSSEPSAFDLCCLSMLSRPSACRSLEVVCKEHLGTGEGKVFDELISLKSQATYLATREPVRPDILYDKYYTTLAFRGRNLVVSELQSGLNSLISNTWEQLLDLSGGTKIPVDVPVNMSEDFRSTAMGYSFIDHVATSPPTLPLLYEMSKLPGFNLFKPAEEGSGQTFMADRGAFDDFLHTTKEVVEAIAFLVHTTGSGPARMSEVVEDRYRNGSKSRNLVISHGRVFIYRSDIKTTGMRGMRSSIVHHPPSKVVDLLVYYLSVVRPLETFLAGHLGLLEPHAAYSQFTYVIRGSVLTARAFSDIIARHTEKYFGCRLTGLDLRHVMISMQAVFLPPFVDPSVQTFRDSQAGHGTVTANRTYGQRADDLPGEQASGSVLAIHWCGLLHELLGVGPGPPRPPVPYLYTQGEQPWLSLPQETPSASSFEGMFNALQARMVTTLATIANDISRNSEKTTRDAVFKAVATLGASALPFLGQTPSSEDPATIPDAFEAQASSVSVGEILLHTSYSLENPQSTLSDAELHSILSLYTGRLGSSFTSENQKSLLRAVLDPKQENIIAILPTGSGKSIAIFAPVLVETSGITVVITSHCALRRQLADQAASFSINHLVWNRRNHASSPDRQSVRLVIMLSDELVSPEAQQ